MKAKIYFLLILFQVVDYAAAVYNILDFGALQGEDHVSAQFANQRAFLAAVAKANSTLERERVVKLPKGVFYSMPIRM